MDDTLTRLDPRFKRVMMIQSGIFSLFLLGAGIIGDLAIDGLPPVFTIAALILGIGLTFVLPIRRYRSRGYSMDDDRLRTVQGVWNHWDILVPFTRVQHLDVHQGPLERANGISTLVLHTAGTENSSVALPGLAYEDAIAMRDTIRDMVQARSQ